MSMSVYENIYILKPHHMTTIYYGFWLVWWYGIQRWCYLLWPSFKCMQHDDRLCFCSAHNDLMMCHAKNMAPVVNMVQNLIWSVCKMHASIISTMLFIIACPAFFSHDTRFRNWICQSIDIVENDEYLATLHNLFTCSFKPTSFNWLMEFLHSSQWFIFVYGSAYQCRQFNGMIMQQLTNNSDDVNCEGQTLLAMKLDVVHDRSLHYFVLSYTNAFGFTRLIRLSIM